MDKTLTSLGFLISNLITGIQYFKKTCPHKGRQFYRFFIPTKLKIQFQLYSVILLKWTQVENSSNKKTSFTFIEQKYTSEGLNVADNSILAEREGFEPSVEFNPHTRLAGEHHRPTRSPLQ